MLSESLKIKTLIITSLIVLWSTYFFISPPVVITETIEQNCNEEANDQKKNTEDNIKIKSSILNKDRCSELVNLWNKYKNWTWTITWTWDIIIKNLDKAKEYFIEACNWSCWRWCNEMWVMYYYWEWLNINYFKAKDFFVKTCNLKYSCTNLWLLYEKWLITKYPDYLTAMDKYKRSCMLNLWKWCYLVWNLYSYWPWPRISRVVFQASRYYKKSCDLGYEKWCKALKEYTR